MIELVGCALLEGINESNQIGAIRKTLTKEMNVIRHDAVSVERESLLNGVLQKVIEQPTARKLIRKKRGTLFSSNRNEIDLTAAILI